MQQKKFFSLGIVSLLFVSSPSDDGKAQAGENAARGEQEAVESFPIIPSDVGRLEVPSVIVNFDEDNTHIRPRVVPHSESCRESC
jgi:hypothetical protein